MENTPVVYVIEDYDFTSVQFAKALHDKIGTEPIRLMHPKTFPKTLSPNVKAIVCDLYFKDGPHPQYRSLPIYQKYAILLRQDLPSVISHVLKALPTKSEERLSVGKTVFVYSLYKHVGEFKETPSDWVLRAKEPLRCWMRWRLSSLARTAPQMPVYAASSKIQAAFKTFWTTSPVDLITLILEESGIPKEHTFAKREQSQQDTLVQTVAKLCGKA